MNEAPPDSLRGQTAVVTGASGGIGQSVARYLAAAGATTLLHAHSRASEAERLAGEIVGAGGEAQVLTADLSDPAQLDTFVGRCWSTAGKIDIWINNAGADVLTGTAAKHSFADKLEQLWQVDVRATLLLSRQVGQRMQAAGGVILNVGWDQAESGMAGDAGEMFAACKGAVMSFSRSLAKSLAPKVRVNCLAPGWIRTAWGQEMASAYWDRRAHLESLRDRWGTPEDVARCALFLVSPAADFVTGQILSVNGGLAGYDRWCPRDSESRGST